MNIAQTDKGPNGQKKTTTTTTNIKSCFVRCICVFVYII